MLYTVFLWTLLAQAPASQSASTQPEAVRLAEDGQNEAALKAFQARAAANPDDLEARMWIARLHERMGHVSRAEAVYRSVLLEDPSNVDAMLGVGNSLLARDASAEAIEVLERAERLAPKNPDVLEALGRAHGQAGHSTIGVRYLQLASALAPTDQQHRLALEGSRFAHLNRVELRGYGEDFNGSTPNSRSGDLTVNLRLTDRLRVLGRGQVQRKFSVSDERGGAGIAWRWRPMTTFGAQALVGPSNRVMPEGDYAISIDHRHRSTGVVGELRFFDFLGANVVMVSPGVEWAAGEKLSFGLRYAVSVTDAATLPASEIGHTVNISSTYQLVPRVAFTLGYAHGIDNFENFSIDQIGAFNANTGSAGVRVDLPSLTSLRVTYDYQQRRGAVEMRRLTLSIAQRF